MQVGVGGTPSTMGPFGEVAVCVSGCYVGCVLSPPHTCASPPHPKHLRSPYSPLPPPSCSYMATVLYFVFAILVLIWREHPELLQVWTIV